MLWNSVLQACLQAYSKIPSLVWVLLAHRQLVQLVHNHALECWKTKAEFHPIAVQISRVSNQNRLHLCHDRVWFSGDVGILSHPASQQLEKGFLSSPGHNPSQPLVTVSSSATAPSSPCVSPGILLSDSARWVSIFLSESWYWWICSDSGSQVEHNRLQITSTSD